jgi:hypothetical protein
VKFGEFEVPVVSRRRIRWHANHLPSWLPRMSAWLIQRCAVPYLPSRRVRSPLSMLNGQVRLRFSSTFEHAQSLFWACSKRKLGVFNARLASIRNSNSLALPEGER